LICCNECDVSDYVTAVRSTTWGTTSTPFIPAHRCRCRCRYLLLSGVSIPITAQVSVNWRTATPPSVRLHAVASPKAAAQAAPAVVSMNPSDVESTLRPRTRRLISVLDDGDGEHSTNGPAAVELSASANARAGPDAIARFPPARTAPSWGLGRAPSRSSSALGSSLAGAFTSSLSTLQGLATNVLGGGDGRDASIGPTTRKTRPAMHVRRRSANSIPPAEWGPAPMSPTRVGAGSTEERTALVRDAKRKGMLSANGHSLLDSTGRHKRRISDDMGSTSVPPPEDQEGDAMVYIHHVQPRDTLAGLTIKYSCPPNVLRKANRMWPNDPIQVRKTIVLPVDACGVRGKRVSGPDAQPALEEEEDLLGDYTITMHESPSSPSQAPINGWLRDKNVTSMPQQPASSDTFPSSPAASSVREPDQPWKHESWVLLPNDSHPTEIARLPRRDLGYFPRARRKSVTFSDIGTSRNTSFEITRPGASSPVPMNSSPRVRGVGSPAARAQSSSGRTSIQLNRTRSSSNTMSSFLSGPGGVGSLGKSARKPGPGPDRLNDVIGPKLPKFLAPPSSTAPYMPWVPPGAGTGDLLSFGPSAASEMYAAQPGTSTPTGGMDLQELGGAVESWMRKMAKKASTPWDSGAAASSSSSAKGTSGGKALGVDSGPGDLIELVDAFGIGDSEDAMLPPSSEGLLGGGGAVMAPHSSESSAFHAGGDGEVRGRRRMRAFSSRSKNGKGD
jgi:hypothetical protein